MKKSLVVLVVLVVAAVVVAVEIWCAMYRVVPQPALLIKGPVNQYFYGSVEAEQSEGIPYWIWLVLPRVFPEYMPGVGGYAAFGLSWQEEKELPVGFAKQRIGYIRVTGNCALCHAQSSFYGDNPVPKIISSVPGTATDIKPLLDFYRNCAADPRFTAGDILAEVGNATALSFTDSLLYRYVLIPRARKQLLASRPELLFGPMIRDHLRDSKTRLPRQPLPKRVVVTQLE